MFNSYDNYPCSNYSNAPWHNINGNKNYRAEITMREVTRNYQYNDIDMLSLTINYPMIHIHNNKYAELKINNQIYMQVDEYYNYVLNTLYLQAIDAYKSSQENDYPFHPYEAVMKYTITYNDNCFLSLYRDKYEFTGGAHGSTIRESNTWELCTGESIYLYYLFGPYTDYTVMLQNYIINQAKENLNTTPDIYFDNYETLIVNTFNPKSFYLTPEGITIYYQQYDIAPYSTGIVEFTIPYNIIGWYPSCS